jgi:hypothetical protein
LSGLRRPWSSGQPNSYCAHKRLVLRSRLTPKANPFRRPAYHWGGNALPAQTDQQERIVNSYSQLLTMGATAPSQTSVGEDPWNLQQAINYENRTHSHRKTTKCVRRIVPPQHDDRGPGPNGGEETEHRQ